MGWTHPDIPTTRTSHGVAVSVLCAFGALLSLLLLSLLLVAPAAQAEEAPAARGIDGACPFAAQQLDRFVDVSEGPHVEAINCSSYYLITQGRDVADDGRGYAPGDTVTRGQMATFTTRMLELVTQDALPVDEAFIDDAVVHQPGIRKLATIGVVAGVGGEAFAPGREVTRGQMATFIARSLEFLLDEELPSADPFPDISGTTHADNIRKLSAVDVVTGLPDGTYGPGQPVTREQMASFLARAMDLVAAEGLFPDLVEPVSDVPATQLREGQQTPGLQAVTEVRDGSHIWFDRLVFDIEGEEEGEVGWQVEYVDAAVDPGSGGSVEVAGDAILAVTLTGVALPPELPEDIAVWDVDRLDTPDLEVVTEVVNSGTVEGRHTFFVGTEQVQPFAIERLSDPQRIVIDVFLDFPTPERPEIQPPLPERQVVSSFTTDFIAPDQPRNHNIQLAADYIDGDVIGPGESYSLNLGIGPRTSARGFGSNGFIDDDGEVISVVGGGVSQMGTTFLNAAWFAGIQLDEFRPHSIYFPRYPMCREATLIWDVLDVRVTNDSPYAITIDTEHDATSVTVNLVSRPWAEVDSWIGQPFDVAGPGGAFSVRCGRTVTYPDGTTSSDEHFWRYDEGFPG